MIYKTYGKTGKKVSAVGFGGMRFDQSKSIKENAELIRYANSKLNVVINYDGFEKTDLNFYFPYSFKMDVDWGEKRYYLEMRFADIQFNASNLISFSIPKKYDKVYR